MMRVAAAAMAMVVLSQPLLAQTGDATNRLMLCSQYRGEQRLKCTDELIGEMPEASGQPQGSNWIVSDTTSPVNYRPQISALTISRRSTQDAPSALVIQCRGGRTDLLLSPATSVRPGSAGEVRVVYRINGQPRTEQRWRSVNSGKQLAFQGDVVGLLRAMPEDGQLSIEIFAGDVLAGKANFRLAGLDAVRRRIAASCHWS